MSATVALGQGTSSVGIGYASQSVRGNRDSFASQLNLAEGLFLDSLQLDLSGVFAGVERFELTASGFGAEPWQRAGVRIEWDGEWKLQLDYARRESFFVLPGADRETWHNTWAITRWAGSVTYEGWRAARLRLDLRDVRRSGARIHPFYGLGLAYVGRRDLDERVQEAGLSIETMTLPVKIILGQDYARYARRNRAAPANGGAPLEGTDPETLTFLETPGEDTSSVPTTRLAAVYRADRVEVQGSALYRRDHTEVNRDDVTGYSFGGGQIGEAGFVDALVGSADRDLARGDLRVGVSLTSFLTFRVRGRYEDVSTDTSLVGERLLRALGPGAGAEVGLPESDWGFLNRTDREAAIEADLQTGPVKLVVSYLDASRDVDWQRVSTADPSFSRDLEAWSVTASFASGTIFSAELGWQDRSFSSFVFRTDPDVVQRLWARLRLRPVQGLELSLHARDETAENPDSLAALDHSSSELGAAATYTSPQGAFVSVSADRFDLASRVDTSFYGPALQAGMSFYNTTLKTIGLRGGAPLGRGLRVDGGVLLLEDAGASLPFSSFAYDLRLEVPVTGAVDLGLFGNHWSYDLERSNGEDFDAIRFGVTARWRF